MELNYASNGKANAALTTGIIGTGLGALGVLGGAGNALGNLAGIGVGHPCLGQTAQQYVGKDEFRESLVYQKELMDKDMMISELRSEKISDQKDIEVYKQIKAEMNALEANYNAQFQAINAQLTNQAVQNQSTKDSFQILQERVDANNATLGGAIEREVATRKANDNLIVTYVNSTFTPKVVMETTFSDATVGSRSMDQTTYNPLPCCDCNC